MKYLKVLSWLWITLLCIPANSQDYPEEVWGKADLIVSEISGFNFPGIDYYVTDFKTSNDTTEWYTQAINKAIDVCSEKGGGVVIVPEGIYFTGPIILKSNVRLHISDGAILKFSTNPVDYLPVVETRWEGVDCYNYCPLIYAVNETNIAITGNGILDGQADNPDIGVHQEVADGGASVEIHTFNFTDINREWFSS